MNKNNILNKIFGNPATILIFRIVVGYIFVSFGISKIADPSLFAKEIANYDFAPLWTLNLVALTLPWIEIITGLLLIFGVALKANSILTALMLIWFIFMVAVAWGRGLDISCGCSSINPMHVGFQKILENTIFLAMCVFIMFFPNNKLTLLNPTLKDCESAK
jgi:putative oxidoreductase